jgi:fermentation-respiration switch protein FrsA (DUF1100 family)
MAVMHEDESDPKLAGTIESHLSRRLFRQLDPGPSLPFLRARVFIVHGAHDDLIPPQESRDLYEALGPQRARLLVTPFLTHTHPLASPMTATQKAGAALDVLAFYYGLARELRPGW